MIKNISNEEEGIVTLLEGVKHPYEGNIYIIFNNQILLKYTHYFF